MITMKAMSDDSVKRLQMARLEAEARGFGLEVVERNAEKPWGGYMRFAQDSLTAFESAYWLDTRSKLPVGNMSVDPKILLVAPDEILSLQWHKRRAEIWRVIDGPVRIVLGSDWSDLDYQDYRAGDVIDIPQAQWHRLIGLSGWGRVAEIWRHMDPGHPSDEDDVFRVHDKYSRADVEADPSTPIGERDDKWELYCRSYSYSKNS